MLTIPTTNQQNFSQVTTLSRRNYVFTFHWNAREAAWYMDLADEDENPISLARRITIGFPLITRCTDPRKPPGTLMAIDATGGDLDPAFDDLGSRVQIVYIEPEDLA